MDNQTQPLSATLARNYGQSNQYGSDPNHVGFAGGMFDSIKTGAQGAMQMSQMKTGMDQRRDAAAIAASQNRPTIKRVSGTQP